MIQRKLDGFINLGKALNGWFLAPVAFWFNLRKSMLGIRLEW